MLITSFLKESGFKILAMARLSQCEYSIVFYLLNCAVSGLNQLITHEEELALLIGYDAKTIHDAITSLSKRQIIRIHFGEGAHLAGKHSFSLGMQFDTNRWELDFAKDATSKDAIIYPFRRQGESTLTVLEGQKKTVEKTPSLPTWKRLLDYFSRNRGLEEAELMQAEHDAKILVDTHPVDQVLMMIRHFGLRIPTLSLLASSWQHYQEVFERETQKVDMLEARQKHVELDTKLRQAAEQLLERRQELELGEEEVTVLQILAQHRHPRRQLFWAYQMRSRYPKLAQFFLENAPNMIPVTTMGAIVRRPAEE